VGKNKIEIAIDDLEYLVDIAKRYRVILAQFPSKSEQNKYLQNKINILRQKIYSKRHYTQNAPGIIERKRNRQRENREDVNRYNREFKQKILEGIGVTSVKEMWDKPFDIAKVETIINFFTKYQFWSVYRIDGESLMLRFGRISKIVTDANSIVFKKPVKISDYPGISENLRHEHEVFTADNIYDKPLRLSRLYDVIEYLVYVGYRKIQDDADKQIYKNSSGSKIKIIIKADRFIVIKS